MVELAKRFPGRVSSVDAFYERIDVIVYFDDDEELYLPFFVIAEGANASREEPILSR